MLTFMDYVVHAFSTSTDWNHENSYSSLTATSDALVAFPIPGTLSLYVSSLSTPNFATSYTLSTVGQIDGSLSYLYATVPLGHVPSRSPSIPLRTLVRGYRDIRLPQLAATRELSGKYTNGNLIDAGGRRPTLLHATLALPPPSTLTAIYARRINAETLLSVSLNSKSVSTPPTSSVPPPASVLAHLQYDTGRYSIEGLGSTDHALLGVRGLWNFGLGQPKLRAPPSPTAQAALDAVDELTDLPVPLSTKPSPLEILAAHRASLAAKPSLLSAGAEFYYSPSSHVIGLSTGLRFTTLAPHITCAPPTNQSGASPSKPLAGTSALLSSALLSPANISHSSFPYTMTLTLTPLTGSLASTYSVKPTPNLALSSRFDFNVYSWESRYIIGAEIWRQRRKRPSSSSLEDEDDPVAWAKAKMTDWFSEAELMLKRERVEREEENVVKIRVDDGWNLRALWTGRVKELLVSAGVSVSPVKERSYGATGGFGGVEGDIVKKWTGTVGVEIAYSS